MVAVFAGFASGDLVMFQQMGFGLGVAILVDATIVRVVLMPAVWNYSETETGTCLAGWNGCQTYTWRVRPSGPGRLRRGRHTRGRDRDNHTHGRRPQGQSRPLRRNRLMHVTAVTRLHGHGPSRSSSASRSAALWRT